MAVVPGVAVAGASAAAISVLIVEVICGGRDQYEKAIRDSKPGEEFCESRESERNDPGTSPIGGPSTARLSVTDVAEDCRWRERMDFHPVRSSRTKAH